MVAVYSASGELTLVYEFAASWLWRKSGVVDLDGWSYVAVSLVINM